MGALKSLGFATAILVASPAQADPLDRWNPYISEASARFGLPRAWIREVIRIESGGATRMWGAPVVSRAGAMGLMQLMPGTWSEMRRVLKLGPDPHDPRNNILAGSLYLRQLYDRFGYPGLFAAYNAGPGRYSEHLAGRRRLPVETRRYVAQLAGSGVPAGRRRPSVPSEQLSVGTLRPGLFAQRPGASLFVQLTAYSER